MDTRPVIYASKPQERNLSSQQWELVKGILRRIESGDTRLMPDSPESATLVQGYEYLHRSNGVLVIALSQWEAHRLHRDKTKNLVMPSEFTHLTNVMTMAAKKPLLVLREKTVAERGSLRRGYVHPVLDIPRSAYLEWLETFSFQGVFAEWLKKVKEHKHVFLGYSSQARDTASAIKRFLVDKLDITVLDWHDFQPSEMIMQRIEKAEQLTICGIFLFMADDHIELGTSRHSAPRDNVVYEAGYFAGAKGQRLTLVIREQGAKIPTDLAGLIYLELQDRTDISPIETRLREYFAAVLQA